MKIVAINNIKYGGKLYPPGKVIEVKKEIAEELIEGGVAKVYEEVKQETAEGGEDNGSIDK